MLSDEMRDFILGLDDVINDLNMDKFVPITDMGELLTLSDEQRKQHKAVVHLYNLKFLRDNGVDYCENKSAGTFSTYSTHVDGSLYMEERPIPVKDKIVVSGNGDRLITNADDSSDDRDFDEKMSDAVNQETDRKVLNAITKGKETEAQIANYIRRERTQVALSISRLLEKGDITMDGKKVLPSGK